MTINLPATAIRNPRLMVTLVVTIGVWGYLALVDLPRQEEPILTWRLANVVVRKPGLSAKRVEALITDILERRIEQVDEVEHIYSVSRSGVALLQVELSDDVTDAAPVWQKVRHKINAAKTDLPPDIIGPELDDEIMGTYAMLISITSEERSLPQLKQWAKALEDHIRYLPNTASTALFGTQREVIRIELDSAQMAARQLSYATVSQAIKSRNARTPAGRIGSTPNEIVIEATGEFLNDQEVAEMILLIAPGGQTVRLGDFATISRTTIAPEEPLARVDGAEAVILGVRARPHVRMDLYGKHLQQIVARFRDTLPDDVRANVVHNLARYTKARSDQLTVTLLLSLLFVSLSTFCFMGWRGSLVVTAAIPVTGLTVLILFSLLNIPLNEMSVMAIIMSMGLLVDNAIVVTEQIQRHATDAEIKTAAVAAASSLVTPLLVSTLTTIAAFAPIYLLPGGVGEFVRAIPLGVSICLLTSLAVALTIVPWIACYVFSTVASKENSGARQPNKAFLAAARQIELICNAYQWLLQRSLASPRIMLCATLLLLAGIGSLGLELRRDFFSPVERDQFVLDVYAVQGSSLAHTSHVVAQIEKTLSTESGIAQVVSFIGRNAPLVFYNLTSQETYANHFAQLIVTVEHSPETASVARQIQERLSATISDADCVVHGLEHGAPATAPFVVRISGPSIETLTELGRRTETLLANTEGVRQIRNDYGQPAIGVQIEVNKTIARQIGITHKMVADELRMQTDGIHAGFKQEGDERVDLRLRAPIATSHNLAALSHIYFKPNDDQRLIPFSAVAKLQPQWKPNSVYRRDGRRTLSVLAYPDFTLTAAQASRHFTPQLQQFAQQLPPDYTLELGGENEQRSEAETNLLKKAVYAACLIFLLLVAEFRSMRLTGLILAIVPLSIAGTMLALWLTGWPLNFMAIMGMMMLLGIVVNDAVILVDGYQSRLSAGQPLNELIVAGTIERSRHVIITTVTTIAGFLPLAFSPSLLWPPLALAIIGGLTISTLLTLLVIPAAYYVLCPQAK